ncbi:hypothetical protein [Serratia sp. JSRIV004]|uniref:hypothetical protein n=1 Tax=Serratia sp. JSRIV004 TaxID=2831895 RepID=UPI001CC00F18|nr:hypothetical protein [Serratia sp. JSRIV004]
MKPNIQLLPLKGQEAALEVIKARLSSPGMSAAGASEVKKITEIFMDLYGVKVEEEEVETATPMQICPNHFIFPGTQLSIEILIPESSDVKSIFSQIEQKYAGRRLTPETIAEIEGEAARMIRRLITTDASFVRV